MTPQERKNRFGEGGNAGLGYEDWKSDERACNDAHIHFYYAVKVKVRLRDPE